MKKQKSEHLNRIPLFDSKGNKAEVVELDKEVFNGKPNESLLYQAILMYRANKRRGTASSKTRAEVRGGGKKPWRQKGTGRARVASIRNPIWRGGGTAFGPHPRDFSYSLPKKLRQNAFISSINAKLKSGLVSAVENLTLSEPKTKAFAKALKGLKTKKKVLFLTVAVNKNLKLASRNIKNLTLRKLDEATAYDVLSNEHVVMTKDATEALNKKVKK